MTPRRVLALLLAAAAATAMVTGNAAFTSGTLERGVTIDVADPEDAVVGTAACTNPNSQSGLVHVRLSNRGSHPVEVTAVYSDEADTLGTEAPSQPNVLAVGESRQLVQRFDAASVESVVVEVIGAGFDATLVVPVAQSLGPDCPGNAPQSENATTDGGNTQAE